VGIPARIVDEVQQRQASEHAAKLGFAAYAVSGEISDPMVKAVHQMLDHTVSTDQRIEYILEQLKRLGVPVEDEKATADKFDANYLNRIVD
jgi:serine O-acetyltransferase